MLEKNTGPFPARNSDWVLLLTAMSIAVFASSYTPLNTDLGWTLGFGRDVVSAGEIPRVNGHSFLEPTHPMLMHEWASSVALYRVHAALGALGLIALKWLLTCAIVFVIWWTIRRLSTQPIVLLLLSLVLGHLLRPAVLLVRAQLFSWLLLALVVAAVSTGRRRALWACVPLLALWANLHGAFFAGVAVLAAGCAALFLEQAAGWTRKQVAPAELAAIPVVGGLATLLNPYGAQLLTHTWAHSTDEVRRLNREWLPLWPPSSLADWQLAWLVGLGAFLVLALLLLPFRRLRLWTLVVLAIATSLSANRHLRMAPILLAPAAAVMLDRAFAWLRWDARLGRLDRFVPVIGGVSAAVFLIPLLLSLPEPLRFVDYQGVNPGKALWVMRENDLHGKVWNDFNWGGHLLFVAPESQVAVDGRNVAAYSASAVETAILFENDSDPLRALQQSGAELALLRADSRALPALTSVYQPLFCADGACLLSSLPEHHERARRGFQLPPPYVTVSDFFQEHR